MCLSRLTICVRRPHPWCHLAEVPVEMESNLCRDVVLYQPVWKEDVPPLISEIEAQILTMGDMHYDEPFVWHPLDNTIVQSAEAIECHNWLTWILPDEIRLCQPSRMPFIDGSYRRSSLQQGLRDEWRKMRQEEDAVLRHEEERRARRFTELYGYPNSEDLQRGETYTNIGFDYSAIAGPPIRPFKHFISYDITCPPYDADCCPGCMCMCCSRMQKVPFFLDQICAR
ncbi:hypothetical protein DFH06DRAFT_1143106 [Mycena polygramma]|nr:hypothetical protein DFH06DRAFT_1143106 [Mycena polygramma]